MTVSSSAAGAAGRAGRAGCEGCEGVRFGLLGSGCGSDKFGRDLGAVGSMMTVGASSAAAARTCARHCISLPMSPTGSRPYFESHTLLAARRTELPRQQRWQSRQQHTRQTAGSSSSSSISNGSCITGTEPVRSRATSSSQSVLSPSTIMARAASTASRTTAIVMTTGASVGCSARGDARAISFSRVPAASAAAISTACCGRSFGAECSSVREGMEKAEEEV
eukprot:6212972-Pleurochrysis_carterae.AAC.2